MKSLPLLMTKSMLTCFASMPIGCLIGSLIHYLMNFEPDMKFDEGAVMILVLWICGSIFGFPLAFFYGAPLYALCAYFYRPTWWLILLISGSAFWIYLVGVGGFGVAGKYLQSWGQFLSMQLGPMVFTLPVAVSHHLLMKRWAENLEIPESLRIEAMDAPVAAPSDTAPH